MYLKSPLAKNHVSLEFQDFYHIIFTEVLRSKFVQLLI